ncbi:hypothetical protein AUR04nite_01360 [Glutamicibacter uratoxydans]|uniref:Uncharacterized protein n=1 Tax=Glutamicibacter uratoxydans TaxID=43667 RepID=A0A4Y4DLA0_GLUUR|nr:hypothetical protein [Glutamicibacter uratoxydans]GED04604.1 hypothetical protein AUR04nite_01360 [Glutamicibacter uratoxydans]
MSDLPQRPLAPRLAGLFSALFIVAGAVLLWIDSMNEFVISTGSSELLEQDTFYFGPSATQMVGEVLLALGIAALCARLGLILGRRIRQMAQGQLVFIGSLAFSILLLAAGVGLAVWDSTQVHTFGWIGDAPAPPPATFALIAGKLLIGAGLGALGFSGGLKWELKARAEG